jgi:magnesium transporter
MAFFSELIGKPVTDIDGRIIGKTKDIIARFWEGLPHPVVEAIVVESGKDTFTVPYDYLANLKPLVISLTCTKEELHPFTPHEFDIYLAAEVLDKQIIDTNGARVVRVNDLELVRVNGNMIVSNLDIGGLGIMRRIGLDKTFAKILSPFKQNIRANVISWDDVELLRHDQAMRLRVPIEMVSELHPADLANILGDLNQLERGQLLENMDIKQVADTLEEVEPEFQASLLEDMSNEKIADVLEEMAPDEAADLLAEFSKERSEDLLGLMEGEEAEDVRSLLSYPEDSAGGIMNTEYIIIPPDLTAEEAIKYLRENASEAETIFYVYVTDPDEHLLGVISLRTLIMADPQARISSFMVKRIISVMPNEEQNEVAQLVAKYDLLAIPVVDEENHILGIVTSDDALDKIIPTTWKKRMPRIYR